MSESEHENQKILIKLWTLIACLSTSEVLLICGDTVLAGEKLCVYKPDMNLTIIYATPDEKIEKKSQSSIVEMRCTQQTPKVCQRNRTILR